MKDFELKNKIAEPLRILKEAAKKDGYNITFICEKDGEKITL